MNKKLIVSIVVLIIILISVMVFRYMSNSEKQNTEVIENTLYENELHDVNNEKMEVEEIEEVKDSFVWEKEIPENYHLSSTTFEKLNNSFKNTEITSSIVVKNGKIINEYYKEGYDEESIFPIHSCSKSITSAIFGIAIDNHFIDDLDEPIYHYFPEINDMDSQYKKEITIRHLLTHTSGLKSTEDDWYAWRASSNWVQYILNGNMESKSGTTFDYSTGNTHLLSAILQKVTNQTLYEYGKENLFGLIGMKSVKCDTDSQGISDGGNGFTLTARDMARFGLLYVNKGNWNGKQIISEDWIHQSTSMQFKRNSGTADYGYQWWVRTFGTNQYKSYFAQGHGGQFIFVIPDLEMVITFTSNYYDNSHSSDYWQYVNDIVN